MYEKTNRACLKDAKLHAAKGGKAAEAPAKRAEQAPPDLPGEPLPLKEENPSLGKRRLESPFIRNPSRKTWMKLDRFDRGICPACIEAGKTAKYTGGKGDSQRSSKAILSKKKDVRLQAVRPGGLFRIRNVS